MLGKIKDLDFMMFVGKNVKFRHVTSAPGLNGVRRGSCSGLGGYRYRRVSGCPRRRPGRCFAGQCRWRWGASAPRGLWSATDPKRVRSHEPPPGPGRSARPLQRHRVRASTEVCVVPPVSAGTLFPAEPGLAEDPELVVVKMDLSSWRQEGVSQLAVQTVEARVERRPPAVGVVEGVET